jgi:hypothetical protein
MASRTRIEKISTREILVRGRALSASVPEIFSSQLAPTIDGFSRETIPPWRLNGSAVEHPVHRMMSRVGGFPPALARYFIAKYSCPGDLIVDPFCGKGTALFEAARLGRIAAGGDIALDATIVTRAKCTPVSIAEVVNYIQELDISARASIRDVPPDVKLFFSPETFRQLARIRQQLRSDMTKRGALREVSTFVCGILLGILHGHSSFALSVPCNQCFAMSPRYVRKYIAKHGLKTPDRDIRSCLIAKTLEFLPQPELSKVKVFNISAERSSEYSSRIGQKARLVLTSPPYLNRQTYLKDSWLRFWFLGIDPLKDKKRALETGSVRTFVSKMQVILSSVAECLAGDGVLVLVCGRAGAKASGDAENIRISDLCLYAIEQEERMMWRPLSIIHDRKVMKRGSYFAVHAGQPSNPKSGETRRYGVEEILVLKRT